jgi:hypothetical protein
VRFISGVMVEAVGQDFLAVTSDGEAIRLSGNVADSVRRMLDDSATLTPSDVALLDGTGLVEPVEGGVSRRGLVLGSAAMAGAGVVAFSLPAAASAASPRAGIWGDYGAVPSRLVPEFDRDTGQPTGEQILVEDFVEVWVYVSKDIYDSYRSLGNYSVAAGWPQDLDASATWTLLFGDKSLELGASTDTDGTVSYLPFRAYKNEDEWNQDLYDYLKADWAARRTIELSITDGSVTVPVSFYPYPWDEINLSASLNLLGADEDSAPKTGRYRR